MTGQILDVTNASYFFGWTEHMIRSRVRRGLLPFRRLAGRIVFIRRELEQFRDSLPMGCSLDDALANEARRRQG